MQVSEAEARALLSRLIWLPPLSTWPRANLNSNSNACTQVSEAEAHVAALEAELSAAAQRLALADGASRLHLREAERLERGAEAARVAAAEAGVRQGEAEAAANRAVGDCANLRAKVAQTEAAVKVCVGGVLGRCGGQQHVLCEEGVGQGARRATAVHEASRPSASPLHYFSSLQPFSLHCPITGTRASDRQRS